MENYKHFEMKDKYREEANTDVYADEDILTSKPTGSFSNKYVSWLEKIAWEGMNADKSSANCAIFDVSNRYSENDMHEAFRGFTTGKKFEDWLKTYNGC
mgnify:CR=1 FL=1